MNDLLQVIKITGPLLVFGGPYSNLEATAAILAEACRRAIPPGNILCSGDLAAYCADPQAVIDLVRRAQIHVVMGNCEELLATQAADCGCGFAEDSACAALSNEWYAFADRNIDAESRIWMGSLPRRIDIEINGRLLTAIHGSVTSINRFVFATSDPIIEEELIASSCDGVIAGHCGLPFSRVINGHLWHNAGVVGMPANDGTPRAWFSVLAPAFGGIAVEHHALEYDYGSAAAKMRDRGLPEGYAAALETGLWPNCDILPAEELKARGKPIEPGSVFWSASGTQAEQHWPCE